MQPIISTYSIDGAKGKRRITIVGIHTRKTKQKCELVVTRSDEDWIKHLPLTEGIRKWGTLFFSAFQIPLQIEIYFYLSIWMEKCTQWFWYDKDSYVAPLTTKITELSSCSVHLNINHMNSSISYESRHLLKRLPKRIHFH